MFKESVMFKGHIAVIFEHFMLWAVSYHLLSTKLQP